MFGQPLHGLAFTALTAVIAAAAFTICWRLMRSPFGTLAFQSRARRQAGHPPYTTE